MTLSIIIPILLIIVAMFALWAWYRRKIADLAPTTDSTLPAATRLTAERLRQLSTPPWRVVHEIAERHLGSIDHVVIGPTGVIAIQTLLVNRPVIDTAETGIEPASDALIVASAAIERGDVDDITRPVGAPCRLLAKVYWGTSQPHLPPGLDVAPGLVAVDGHRLLDWLVSLPPGTLTAADVDRVWQAVTTGIGRPDPLG